jgi:hypothetical protein
MGLQREKEIETLEREIGLHGKSDDGRKRTDDGGRSGDSTAPPQQPSSPLREPTMARIPQLPMVYQPNGEDGRGHVNYLESVDAILGTEFTPPDRYFTISALLGRLREPLKLPHPPNSRLHAHLSLAKSRKNDAESEERKRRLALEKQRALHSLDGEVAYHAEQPDATLLALYKKISAHRTAAVFRKPVNPAEGEFTGNYSCLSWPSSHYDVS